MSDEQEPPKRQRRPLPDAALIIAAIALLLGVVAWMAFLTWAHTNPRTTPDWAAILALRANAEYGRALVFGPQVAAILLLLLALVVRRRRR